MEVNAGGGGGEGCCSSRPMMWLGQRLEAMRTQNVTWGDKDKAEEADRDVAPGGLEFIVKAFAGGYQTDLAFKQAALGAEVVERGRWRPLWRW